MGSCGSKKWKPHFGPPPGDDHHHIIRVVMTMTNCVSRSPAWLPGSKTWVWIWEVELDGFKSLTDKQGCEGG